MKNTTSNTFNAAESQFHIILDPPISDNHIYGQRGKIRFMYSDAKKWKEIAQLLAKQQWKRKPMKDELIADIIFFLKRDRDIQGSTKLLFDTFQGIVYKNDNQFTHINLHKMKDKENPRVEITISKL